MRLNYLKNKGFAYTLLEHGLAQTVGDWSYGGFATIQPKLATGFLNHHETGLRLRSALVRLRSALMDDDSPPTISAVYAL